MKRVIRSESFGDFRKKNMSENLKLKSLMECHGIDRLHILQMFLEDQNGMNFIKRI